MNIQKSYSAVNNLYPSVSKTFCLLWRHRDYKIKETDKYVNRYLGANFKFMFAKSRQMGHLGNRVR